MNNSVCGHSDCNEVTPMDMVSIVFDQLAFCSPECAHGHLDTMSRTPTSVAINDPQYAIPRDDFPGVSEDEVLIKRTVTGMGDAHTAIDELDAMYPGDFRPSVGGDS